MNGPYKNFDVTTDDRGVATVSLDVPNRPLNVLGHDVMLELDQIVRGLETSEGIKLVVFQSTKESGFLAGADVSAISGIDSAKHAIELIEAGQNLFQRIEWLPMPTVAVLHGPCLGGGLELSLACDYRVARDNSSTKIGLPEIKLGLIPGWGGTQRLPRVVGLTNALQMILTGKHLNASEAFDIGLIDLAILPDRWVASIAVFIEDLLTGDAIEPSTRRRSLMQRMSEATGIGRALIFRMTEKSIRSKVDAFPALAAAVRAVRLGYEGSMAGFLCERDEFVDLLATPTCRHLLGLFFARERARSLKTWTSKLSPAIHATPIRKIGVVGAGAMGAGIGQLAAVRGYEVVMKEISEEAVEAGRARIEKLVGDLALRKGWQIERRTELLSQIGYTTNDVDLKDCDLVVEAVVERDDVKAKVFGSLDRNVKPSAILASNTSSLSVTKMAAATNRATQVAGLHFFNPVHRMELVEVVKAAETDEATIARLVGFVKALGKTPIVTSDSPGFLVNRVLFPYLGEAVAMVAEGHDVKTIDKQVRRFGMPMGPLELLDQVGLDVALHVATSLDGVLSGVEPVVKHLSMMVDRGQIGKKVGRGFYSYKKGKRGDVMPRSEPVELKPQDLERDFLDDGMTGLQRRLVYPMLCEAVRCLEEGVVTEPWAIDLAMVLGTGFAPHRGGPLHVIDAIGLATVSGNLARLRTRLGERFAPPKRLFEMLDHGDLFFGSDPNSQQQVVHAS
ncbi:MAG: 3-hydroxyacyl-CoA dehydrogenase NAD-binding domain-containing protein [Rubripirellula sp.]